MNPKIQPNPDSLKAGAHGLAKRLAGAGFQAYWVGGCVRDDRLGQAPTDYDIATDATPDEIEQLFRKTIPVGKQYGVIMVLEAGHEYQVATFRAEGDYTDGRRPGSVRFTFKGRVVKVLQAWFVHCRKPAARGSRSKVG